MQAGINFKETFIRRDLSAVGWNFWLRPEGDGKVGVSGSAVISQGTHLECGKSRFRPGDLNVRFTECPE